MNASITVATDKGGAMRAQQQLPSRALGLASAVLGPGTLAAAPLHLSCSDEREGQLVLQWPLGIAAGSGGIPIPGNGRRSICERGSITACTAAAAAERECLKGA